MKTVLAINGGNGVFIHPLKKYLLANIEPRSLFSTPNNVQWLSNFPKTPLYKNLEQATSLEGVKIDLLIGAPDCGQSSILYLSRNKVYGNPKENKSLNMYFEGIKLWRPKLFVMENLPKMLELVELDFLKKLGYSLRIHQVSVTAFGNSQKERKRLILIGALNRKDLGFFKLPSIIPDLKTCKELIGDLKKENPELCNVREPLNTPVTMYGGYKITHKEARHYWKNNGGSRWKVEGRKFTTAPGVYRNTATELPRTARKANRQFNHWGLMMGPRELARIQGVPDSFRLVFNEDKRQYWINKGRVSVTKCPPYELGLWVKKCFEKYLKNQKP